MGIASTTHPLIKSLAFPDKNDVTLDKVRIERLQEGEDNVPGRRRKTVSQYDTCEIKTHTIKPIHIMGLDCSNSRRQE